ncbi:hypothetical protein [Hippea alviniae]|uniref:hypothetical protein n=1 Tax=Hippea alviniae TaxID=1279027 RepID=UPI0003B35888|nr:hypothetical protein [Hippea alviniae]
MKLNKRCISLYSGGLDSLLSTLLIKNLGFEVFPLFVKTPFYPKDEKKLKEQLKPFGLNLNTVEDRDAYIEMLKKPKYGYGKNLNPCIDCKIFFYKKAKEFAEEVSATFIITGEVLGQRPMSQKSYSILRLIEKEAELKDLVLRPLSAKCLPETLMEKEGLINREKLFCIQGRSRKSQFELAEELGIKNFETPAGGCLLTDPQFSLKIKEMLNRDEIYDENAIKLIKFGRHFRIYGLKFIVSRNEMESKLFLEEFKDLPKIRCIDAPCAVGLFLKEPHMDTILTAAAILKRYSKKAKNLVFEGERRFIIDTQPISDEKLSQFRIGGNNA